MFYRNPSCNFYISLWTENVRDVNILVRERKKRDSLLQKPNIDGRKTEKKLVLEKLCVNKYINNFIIIFTHIRRLINLPPFSN